MEKIKIETIIDAKSSKFWEAYNSPQHIVNWNFASDDWHCPSAETDLQPGGKYKARMEAKDGSFGFDLEAIYDEIIPHEKLEYTLLDGRKVITTFREEDEKIKVVTEFEAENQNPLEMQKEGWQAILDNFKKYVETLS